MINEPLNDDITGVEVYYYFVCKKKLWYFSHGIQMEHKSELVLIGSEIQKESFIRKRKEIDLGPIKIDFIENEMIAEVKKSQKLEEAHIWQLKYYLYYLSSIGVYKKGVLVYLEQRKRLSILLDERSKLKIKEVLNNIKEIVALPVPSEEEQKPYCKNCAYYELCRS